MDLLNKFVRSAGIEIFSKYDMDSLEDIVVSKTSRGYTVCYSEDIPEEFIECLIRFLSDIDNDKPVVDRKRRGLDRKWLRTSRRR